MEDVSRMDESARSPTDESKTDKFVEYVYLCMDTLCVTFHVLQKTLGDGYRFYPRTWLPELPQLEFCCIKFWIDMLFIFRCECNLVFGGFFWKI